MTSSPRPTQAERRAATRRALLDATLATLVEQGHAATTTTAIVRRAGVSQGALFNHFATKSDLLAATVADVYPRLTVTYGQRLAAALADVDGRPDAELLVPLLDAMRDPASRAAVELLVAARTDPDLAAALAPVEAEHRVRMRAFARTALRGDDAADLNAADLDAADLDAADLDAAVDLALDVCLGIVVGTTVADAGRVPTQLALVARLLAPFVARRSPTGSAPQHGRPETSR